MIATLLFSLFQVCFGKIRAKKYHPWIQNSRLRRNRTRLFTYVLRTDEKLIVYSDLCVSFIFRWTEMTNGHYTHCIIWCWKSNGPRVQVNLNDVQKLLEMLKIIVRGSQQYARNINKKTETWPFFLIWFIYSEHAVKCTLYFIVSHVLRYI